jgi:hypothetical protein
MDFVGEENGTMTLRVSTVMTLCVRPVTHAVFRILRLCGLFFDLLVAGAPAVLPWARVSGYAWHTHVGHTHSMVQLGGDSAVLSAGSCLARSPTPLCCPGGGAGQERHWGGRVHWPLRSRRQFRAVHL